MKALVTAGGNGTRLRPITYTMNKHLIPVANKPMIVYALEKIAETGIQDVALNINEGDTTLSRIVGDGSQWGLRVTYLEQVGGAQGLAHIIKNARAWLGDDDFLFYLGDNIILGSLTEFIEQFRQQHADAYLALSRVVDPQRFGVPEIAENGTITRIMEKPEVPPSDFAVTGIYCYTRRMHEAVEATKASERGEYEISDAHNALLGLGGVIRYQIVEGWWKDTGKPADLLEGNSLLLDLIKGKNDAAITESSVITNGAVELLAGAELRGNTVLHGPVSIGEGTVLHDAVVGPHVSIGAHAVVEGTTIRNSIIMEDAHINAKTEIANSIIGHNVTIRDIEEKNHPAHTMIVGENSLIEL